MLSRLVAARRCSKVMNPSFVMTKRFYQDGYCQPHMNELPIACGNFQDTYNDRQSTYGKMFVLGLLWFVGSLAMSIMTDSFYLNWGPPRIPSPPTEIFDECAEDE